MCALPESDILQQLEELVSDFRNEYCDGLDYDHDVDKFLTQLCSSIDSRNVLTISEVEEYEAMEAAGEILSGKQLEDLYDEINVEDNEDYEENNFLIEQIETEHSHIEVLSDVIKTIDKEIHHVCSGMHQLQQKEKVAHYNQRSEAIQCVQLDSQVYSIQKNFLRELQNVADMSANYENMKTPMFIGQMPYEAYKQLCFQFDRYVKVLMKQLLDWNKSTGKEAVEKLTDLEQRYIDMKVEYLYMSAAEKGKKQAMKVLCEKISNILSSESKFTIDEIRNQSLLLEDEVYRLKEDIMFILENEVVPVVMNEVKMKTLYVRKCRNEMKFCKQKFLHKQLEALANCLDDGLMHSELLLFHFTTEKQKLTDLEDLYQQWHEEILDDYSQYKLRMEAMQKLKERYKNSAGENPLIERVRRLFEDNYSIGQSDCKNLLSRTKNLSLDIRENEEKRFSMFNRLKISFIQSEKFLRNTDIVLYSGLSRRALTENKEISTQCNDIQERIKSFQETLCQIMNKFQQKKNMFLENSLEQEKRLLWTYFLVDPKKLVHLIEYVEELHERKQMVQKKKNPFLEYKIDK